MVPVVRHNVGPSHSQQRRCIRLYAAAFRIFCTTTAVALYHKQHLNKQPFHTSVLTGKLWIEELLNGHPDRIKDQLGCRKHVFRRLVTALRKHASLCDSKHVTLEEKIVIFLYTATTGLSVRFVGERFQRSNDTISKCVICFSFLIPVSAGTKVTVELH